MSRFSARSTLRIRCAESATVEGLLKVGYSNPMQSNPRIDSDIPLPRNPSYYVDLFRQMAPGQSFQFTDDEDSLVRKAAKMLAYEIYIGTHNDGNRVWLVDSIKPTRLDAIGRAVQQWAIGKHWCGTASDLYPNISCENLTPRALGKALVRLALTQGTGVNIKQKDTKRGNVYSISTPEGA